MKEVIRYYHNQVLIRVYVDNSKLITTASMKQGACVPTRDESYPKEETARISKMIEEAHKIAQKLSGGSVSVHHPDAERVYRKTK